MATVIDIYKNLIHSYQMKMTKRLSREDAGEILHGDPHWISFSENNHGATYWNEVTGQIMWVPDEGWGNLSTPIGKA